jgi:hypothetical protein
MKRTVNGVDVELTEAEAALVRKAWRSYELKQLEEFNQFGYRKRRSQDIFDCENLSIENQLDACYHGFKSLMDNGTPLPRPTRKWIRELTRIKEKHPRPENHKSC